MENDLYILSEKFFYYYVKETKPTHPPPIISRHNANNAKFATDFVERVRNKKI